MTITREDGRSDSYLTEADILALYGSREPERCAQCGSSGMERYCSRPTCGAHAPNRLYGATITPEGDAI